ncbi:hypothetical protein HUO13_02420 [Saccharopolyspora erythraea]|uniref:hypothetical protein n=1 Tax=Saccharopolyspora erythraea TaxID=1836 RepID=UPI001BA811C4|nr:hypothetical protein [Saccharopolyspora erythraea]QUG99806.1 hypothetical protein HUO13_02420 [Saccharopolyspora erythraea]
MYIEWESGRTQVADWQDEFCEVFELPPQALGFVTQEPESDLATEIEQLEVVRIDREIVDLFEMQTDHFRAMDRKMGAAIIPQTVAHVEHMREVLRNSMGGMHHDAAALALAEGAALAGWQQLDSGNIRESWAMHSLAKSAAKEGDNPAILAHVTVQQAYALLDANRTAEALELAKQGRAHTNEAKYPPRLRAWLLAAEAEFHAACGATTECKRLLDNAAAILPEGDNDPDLPFLFLNQVHLARWRGSSLARLGDQEAVNDLTAALADLPAQSTGRAEAGLRVDLAIALSARGEQTEAKAQANRASELAQRSRSARQRARINRLLIG